jgi:hypothetical protein
MTFRPGQAILIRTAYDKWIEAVALGDVEPTHHGRRKIHNFPIVPVKVTTRGPAIPWPAEDVKPR